MIAKLIFRAFKVNLKINFFFSPRIFLKLNINHKMPLQFIPFDIAYIKS
jgi:hypothetical protein